MVGAEAGDKIYLTKGEIAYHLRLPQNQKSADKLLNFYHSRQFSFDAESLFEVFRRIARAIPMDSRFGGQDFACTSRYRFRSKDDPRFTDRRMQVLLRCLTSNLHQFDIHQLSHLFYSIVKLRLPEDKLITTLLTSSLSASRQPERTKKIRWI